MNKDNRDTSDLIWITKGEAKELGEFRHYLNELLLINPFNTDAVITLQDEVSQFFNRSKK